MLQPRWACSPPPPTHNPAPRHHQTLHDTVEGLVEVGLLNRVPDPKYVHPSSEHARGEAKRAREAAGGRGRCKEE